MSERILGILHEHNLAFPTLALEQLVINASAFIKNYNGFTIYVDKAIIHIYPLGAPITLNDKLRTL